MKIELKRPLIFFDEETTGTSVQTDKIVSIAVIKVFPNGEHEQKSMLINPGVPIPKDASDIHGITDNMVATAPYFRQIQKGLHDFFRDCDVAGYNSDQFDFPMLIEEFHRCGVKFPDWELHLIDSLKIERVINSHKLENTYKRYTGESLDNAHDALADTRATIDVVNGQMPLLEEFVKQTDQDSVFTLDVPTVEKLCQGDQQRFDFAGKCYVKDGIVFWSFGKRANKPVLSDRAYLNWVLNAGFPRQTKDLLTELLTSKTQ